jgi:hypothetical protein
VKRESIGSVIKGVDKLFVKEESTNTNDESSTESEPNINSEIASTVEPNVNVSTNVSGIPKKAKYLETRVQRSYYLNKELVKELDKYAKKNDYDKSDIINWILKEFLSNNGKI